MSEEKPKEDDKQSPWGTLAWGVGLVAIGIGAYFFFDHIEQEGGHVRTHWLVVLVYTTLGKVGVLGLFGVLGALLIALGVKGIAQSET